MLHPVDNVSFYVDDDKFLRISIDMKKHSGVSNSGKSIIVASTRGQVSLNLQKNAEFHGYFMGLSVWRSGRSVKNRKVKLINIIKKEIEKELKLGKYRK